jgi:hypothetical protein
MSPHDVVLAEPVLLLAPERTTHMTYGGHADRVVLVIELPAD